MDRLDAILLKLSGAASELQSIAEEVITSDSFTELMIDANREQLMQGIRADGSRIIPEYAESTIRTKQRKGQPTDRVTLKDTGTFHRALRVRHYAGLLDIWNYDSALLEKLMFKYKESILGVTVENMATLRELALPEIQERAVNYLNTF